MKNTLLKLLIFYVFLMASVASSYAQEELNSLDLAAFLIKNKNYSRANSVLSQIKDPHEVIPERFYALKGILELKQKRYAEALAAFDKAIEEGISENLELAPLVWESMGESYLGIKKYKKGIQLLQSKHSVLKDRVRYYQIKASLHFENREPILGWDIFHSGIKRFPQELSLMKQKWFYLMDQNLIEVSFETAKKIMNDYQISALDLARMGQMYRNIQSMDKAIVLGEAARLKDPSDEEITKDLVRSYISLGNLTASAKLFTELSTYHPDYLVEASELWRKAGHEVMAKNLAMGIRNPVKKLKQSITLALMSEDFNTMVLLGEKGQRTALKEDQDIQYALAYANFMVGDYSTTQKYLSRIQRADLFKKAMALREAMNRCESEVALCF